MDNPISWAILVAIVTVVVIRFALKAIDEAERRKAGCAETWEELANETRESDWWELN